MKDIDSGKFKVSNFISRTIKRSFQNCMSDIPKAPISNGVQQGIPCYSDNSHLNSQRSLYFVPYFDYPIEQRKRRTP